MRERKISCLKETHLNGGLKCVRKKECSTWSSQRQGHRYAFGAMLWRLIIGYQQNNKIKDNNSNDNNHDAYQTSDIDGVVVSHFITRRVTRATVHCSWHCWHCYVMIRHGYPSLVFVLVTWLRSAAWLKRWLRLHGHHYSMVIMTWSLWQYGSHPLKRIHVRRAESRVQDLKTWTSNGFWVVEVQRYNI